MYNSYILTILEYNSPLFVSTSKQNYSKIEIFGLNIGPTRLFAIEIQCSYHFTLLICQNIHCMYKLSIECMIHKLNLFFRKNVISRIPSSFV